MCGLLDALSSKWRPAADPGHPLITNGLLCITLPKGTLRNCPHTISLAHRVLTSSRNASSEIQRNVLRPLNYYSTNGSWRSNLKFRLNQELLVTAGPAILVQGEALDETVLTEFQNFSFFFIRFLSVCLGTGMVGLNVPGAEQWRSSGSCAAYGAIWSIYRRASVMRSGVMV